MTLDQQISEAEFAEQAAQRQYATQETMFLEAQEALRRARFHLAMLKNRRDVLVEIGRPDLFLKPIPHPMKQAFVDSLTGQSKLQCGRCRSWQPIEQTEFFNGGVYCRPCAAIVQRADEELNRAIIKTQPK